MKYLIQTTCVVAIAIGGGLFAFGSYLNPKWDLNNPAQAARSFNVDENSRFEAAAACGFGIGFMTLGGLGLIVPWINVLVGRQHDKADLAETTYVK